MGRPQGQGRLHLKTSENNWTIDIKSRFEKWEFNNSHLQYRVAHAIGLLPWQWRRKVISRQDLIFFITRHYWHSHGSLVQQTVLRDKYCSSGCSWHRNIRNKLLAPQAEMDLKRLSEVSRHKTLGADVFLLKKELDKKQVVLVITIRHTHTPSSLKQYHHEEKVRKYIPIWI